MKRSVGIVGLVALAAGVVGCAPSAEQSVTCVSWGTYASDEDRLEAADLVVEVESIRPDGTSAVYGYPANAYLVSGLTVIKGDLTDASELRVASTADNCASPVYAEGDPMLQDAPLRLYLSFDHGQWITLSPFDGVRPAS
ncbi:hypothetical protein Q9S36_12260 [Microbacterium sp. ARD31]|uniref:hypothetical protein n=1 Tax=Microbacterium sp. ARD31 TaxID=2962576 RepID=UPI002881BEFE|nr:hypothetical protein [Microbacterium sp. ARD31]MDT0180968.1 hypothetical protein [Microbacterium sp. ARD31]